MHPQAKQILSILFVETDHLIILYQPSLLNSHPKLSIWTVLIKLKCKFGILLDSKLIVLWLWGKILVDKVTIGMSMELLLFLMFREDQHSIMLPIGLRTLDKKEMLISKLVFLDTKQIAADEKSPLNKPNSLPVNSISSTPKPQLTMSIQYLLHSRS